MEIINISTLAVGALLLLVMYFWKSLKPRDFPPGPSFLPIIGSLLFLPTKVWKTREIPVAEYMNKTFGDIAGIFDSKRPIIFISNADIVKKLFKMEECSGRPLSKPYQKLRYGGNDGKSRGLLFSEDKEWKEQRRFTMRSLKDLGFGKTTMEEDINQEVEKLVQRLKQECEGKATRLNSLMSLSVVNALWVLLVGEKLALDDPKLLEIVTAIDTFFQHTPGRNMLLEKLGPWAIEKWDFDYRESVKLLTDVKKIWM